MHNYDLVDRLSKQLWDIRFRLAQSIVSPIPDHDKITTAQRILDRLVFLYFIASKGIIRESKETGSECGPKVKSLFGRIVRSSTDFYATLNNIFYKYLNSPDRNRMTIEGQQNLTLRIPYLIGNLFSEKILSSSAGEIQESELAIEAFDWSQLIAELNKYNWVIDSSQAAEPNDMTPAILGHIYEKFVIAMTKIKEIDNLEQLQTSSKGEIRKGKKKIGTHYTPPDIANYIGRSTIFPYAADQIGKNDYNSFDQFIDEYENDSETLDAFAKELQHIRVLDPAVGSGHFLMAAANLLLKLRKQCGDETPEYDLRRDIITNNLFGVDIMEGAVEICKLRLWLWLLAVQDSSQDPDPLPNLDYNIKAGNSLIGVSGKDIPDAISTDVQRYGQSISQYRADEAEKAKLNKETRMLYPKIKSQLDESYLKATNAKLMLEFQSLEEANDALVVGTDSDATLGLKFRQAMAEDLKRCLDSAGFKTWKKTAKMEVNLQNLNAHRLSEIREAIDNYYGIDHVILQRRPTIEDLRVIEPFHWILEFPDIFETKREFDVIIGNPPYGDLCNARERAFMAGRYRTATYNEISANFIERQIETLLREGGYFGNITTSSILANSTMHELHNTIRQNLTDVHTSVFARRPSKVFRNAEINVAITTGRKARTANGSWKTSDFIRFYEEEREGLTENVEYGNIDGLILRDRIGGEKGAHKFEVIPKVGDRVKESILRKLAAKDRTIGDCLGDGDYTLYFRRAANYWMNASIEKPTGATNMKPMRFKRKLERNIAFLVLNSSLFYLYWMTYCNMHDVTKSQITKFPMPSREELQENKASIISVSDELSGEIKKHYHEDTYHQFRMQPVKPLIDNIEEELIGPLYDLSEKQIAYLKNYHKRYGRIASCR